MDNCSNTEKVQWSDSGDDSTNSGDDHDDHVDGKRCVYCFKKKLPDHIKVCKIAVRSSARLVTCKNGSQKFICDICLKLFKYLRSLAAHERRHQLPGGFFCKYCELQFCTEVEREKHTEEKHKVFKCQICKEIFETAEKYVDHIKKLHNGQNREYKACNYCGRLFSSQLFLKYHQETNCGLNGKFKCDNSKCGKTFQTKGRLKIHKLTHSGEKNFCCSFCGQKFRHYMHLQSHEFKHTGKKPFQCNVCQKSFSHRASLATHSTTHTGHKPYLCECCNSRFSCASNIIQHRKKRPDTCGQPQYCKKLAKACPIANMKNPSLLTSEAPIKIFKATKVIKEKDKKKLNKTINESETPINFLTSTESTPIKIESELLICIPDIPTNNVNFKNIEENLTKNLKQEKLNNPELSYDPLIENKDFVKEEIKKLLTDVNVDKSNFKRNLKTHSYDNSKQNVVNFKNNLSSTQKLANGKRIIRCFECPDEIFYFKSVYVRHLRGRHHNKSTEDIEKLFINLNDFEPKNLENPVEQKEIPEFKENEKLFNEKKLIHCTECNNQYFSQKSVYIRHLRGRNHCKSEPEIEKLIENLNGTKPNLKCNICGKIYTIPYYLQKHLEAHDKPEDYCLLSESAVDQLQKDNVEEKKIISCYKCKDQNFSQKSLYIRHLRGRHHNKSESEIEKLLKLINENISNLKCKICGKLYTIEYYLKKHLKTHGIEATHKCKFCDEYFSTSIDVLTHIQLQHQENLTCSICQKVFTDLDSFSRHNQFVHSNKEKKQFICPKCGKKSSSKIALNDHELSNCGKNPIYRCDVCGKCLSTAGILKAHMMLHTNEFPYKCSYCDKGFRFNDKLKVHLRTHTGEKPFLCPYCNKSFGHSSTLYIHISTHTGIKRYMCSGCSNRFSCISGLKAHWRTHAKTCGTDPNRTTKPQLFMGYQKGQLVHKKNNDE